MYECGDIPGPFVLGIISPKIYIPFRIEEEARGYILAHERYHIKRRDYLIKMIAAAILAVYWFHPFVWVAYILMGRDMEMSCDEHVLEDADIQMRVKHSESLLSFATNRRIRNAQRIAFDAHTTRRRVKNVLASKKSKQSMGIVFGVTVVIAAVVLLTQGTDGRPEKPPEKPVQEAVEEKDLTELTAFVELASYSGLQEGWFGELLKQRFHVKLNIESTGTDGMSGSDILVWGDKNNRMTDGIGMGYAGAKNQGKLLSLPDGEYDHAMTVSNAYHDDIFYTWDLRYDLYQKCGKPRIRDLDDLREVLKKMQDMHKGKDKAYGVSAWSSFDETYMAYAGMLCSGYYGLAMNDFVLYDNEGNVYDILDRTQPYMLGDINEDTGEKYDAKYWESYVPEKETSNAMWETWQKDNHASQIQTYLEERGEYMVYSGDGFMDIGKPESWDAVSKIIVQGSWDAVYADNGAKFSKCIEEMRRKAFGAGYRECMEHSTRQVKQRWN